jgi:threonylcarbamoyladenosine tRNA methylthiotransferase MtaB
VGFPGETEEDFADTLSVAEEVGFSKMHIFPFSPRRGTPAAEMSDQVRADVKSERCRRLAELEVGLRERYFGSLKGRTLQVLVESPISGRPGRIQGTACRYAPVDIEEHLGQPGELVDVIAGPSAEGRIVASAVCDNVR